VASIFAALGLSVEGFFTQNSTSGFFEGSGTEVNRPFSLEIFDNIDSAITSGKLWFESTIQQFGSVIGLDIDDQAISQTVEDVVSLLFPHFPVHALPSFIHNIIGKVTAKPSATPLATDQAMENYDSDAWTDDANSELGLASELPNGDQIAGQPEILTSGAEFADQLAGILASSNRADLRGTPVVWNTSPEARAETSNRLPPRTAGIPAVVTVYDGTRRFGKEVPKLLVPPTGAAPKIRPASAVKPVEKLTIDLPSARQSAIAAVGAIGTLAIAGYVKHGRRREESAGGRSV
jgi:hypothetical protein